jgi:protein required for attachment to host cells
MKRAVIAIVDAAKARLYTFEQADSPPDQQLREVRDLSNPGRRMRDSERFSEGRPSLNANLTANTGHATDDHRDANTEEHDSAFAKQVIDELDRVVRDGGFGHVILVASPHMLGELRKCDGMLRRNGLTIDEVQRDLAWLTSPQVHDQLARMNLIPPRQRLQFAQR